MEDFPKSPRGDGSIDDKVARTATEQKALVQAKTIKTVARLLQILSVPKEQALSNEELCRKFIGQPGSNWDTKNRDLPAKDLRNIQRYTKALSEKTSDGPALIEKVKKPGGLLRFYHIASPVTHWLMTDETALNLLLARQILGSTFDAIEGMSIKEISVIADKVADASPQIKRIRQRIRVVPDWIGREAAYIPSEILKETFDAVANDRQLKFRYKHSTGEVITKTVSVQGLVAKDGSLYLLGTDGFNDIPDRGLPLHRFEFAGCTDLPVDPRPDFDLDGYIEGSHKLSHKFDIHQPPIELKLRVAPDAIYHFRERKLSKKQDVPDEPEADGWFRVVITLPDIILLVPFLLSMGGWIEVLEPPKVRAEMAKRARHIAGHYANDVLG